MKIPPAADRSGFYEEIVQACLVSRNDRIGIYEILRCYYLFGCSSDNNPALMNKILPSIALLTSFLFAGETTKYGIVIDDESGEKNTDLPKVPPLTRRLNGKWHRSHADIQAKLAIEWSLVYGTMLLKMIQRGRNTIPYLVEPHSFGVYDESLQFLDDQEAFVHVYTIDQKVLDRLLADHPKRDMIVKNVAATMRQDIHDLPAAVNRIIMSSLPMTSYPNGPGQIASPYNVIDAYRPKTANERVEMRELWVWDDDADDYRIATMASGGICIYDRPNSTKKKEKDAKDSIFYLPGEHPFIQFAPNPDPGYFWGQSEVDRLTSLQDARETRIQQVIELLNRQVKPPMTLKGNWQGIQDETQFAMQVFGAGISSVDPQADAKLWAPTVPQDTFAEVREYDSMINEIMGLSNVTQGKGESGVRSKGHAAELARLGSARIKARANIIEDSLDNLGLHFLRLMQQHDPEKMKDTNGQDFTAEQFTKDYTVKVDGHSSSPIFVEDQKELALKLLEVHAITRAQFIEMTDPPNKQVLLADLQKIEASEAAAKKAEQEAEQKGLRSVK